MAGHVRTIARVALDVARPPRALPHRPWSTSIPDDVRGSLVLSGHLREVPEADTLVVIAHGMGGDADSPYCLRAAAAAASMGYSSLSLAFRGADRSGEDFYHAGQTEDLHGTLACPSLAHYERILVLGYSLGGHTTLKLGTEDADERIMAVAGVCPPLHLGAGQRNVDRRRLHFYRRYLVSGLKQIYREVAKRRDVPSSVRDVNRVLTMYDWDRLTVVPRYGFENPDDYYEKKSVGADVADVRVPALMIAAVNDPLVPPHCLLPYLERPSGNLEVHWVRKAGHLSFSSKLDLGLGPQRGLEHQVMGWFASVLERAPARRASFKERSTPRPRARTRR